MMAKHIPSNNVPSRNGKVMDDGQLDYTVGNGYGSVPSAQRLFFLPEARTVFREFQSCANTEGDGEVLAFLLIFYVWPEKNGRRDAHHHRRSKGLPGLWSCVAAKSRNSQAPAC